MVDQPDRSLPTSVPLHIARASRGAPQGTKRSAGPSRGAGARAQLGLDAPETAIALGTLGEVLVKKGDLAAAEPLLRRALAAQERCLAPDNPESGLTMSHL